MSDEMRVSHAANSWADSRFRTIRTEADWIVHTVDHIRLLLEQYAGGGIGFLSELRREDEDAANVLLAIIAIYGDPPPTAVTPPGEDSPR